MIAETVHAVASATPSVTPSATPVVVVHTVVTHAAATTSSLNDELNKLAALVAPYVVVIGAALATGVQYFLNKFPWFSHEISAVQDLRRRFLAIALPLFGTWLAGIATGQNTLHLAPWVFLVSQILYTTFKAVYGAAQTKVAPQLAVDTPPAG